MRSGLQSDGDRLTSVRWVTRRKENCRYRAQMIRRGHRVPQQRGGVAVATRTELMTVEAMPSIGFKVGNGMAVLLEWMDVAR